MVRYLLAATALSWATVSMAQEPDPATLFGVRQSIEHIDISPDGTKVLYVSPGPGRTSILYIGDLSSSTQKAIVHSSGDPDRLNWCNFVTNDRLICQFTAMSADAGILLPLSRLLALNADGSDMRQLGQRPSSYGLWIHQRDGAIVDWLPEEDGAVLMSRNYIPEGGRTGTRLARTADGLGVDRIDIRTMRMTPVERPNRQAAAYMSDARGNVRMMITAVSRGATGLLGDRYDLFYRVPGSSEWRTFDSYSVGDGQGSWPIAVDAGTNSVYVTRKLDGRRALYRVKLDGSMDSELVHKHDSVDVDGVVRSGRGLPVIGVTFAEEKRSVVYFDSFYRDLAAALGKAIPDLPLIDFVGADRKGEKLLIHAGADNDPGRYFVYDKAARSLAEIMLVRPQLEKIELASVRAVSYPVDGVAIPAYLTLPPGKEAKDLPAVVLPHGGPSARDEWGFDWLAQYLAHQGYAVLQPNYRGSAGYGDDWLQQNGFRSWRTSIGDISAGARWLASQEIADPRRIAAVGWSYGGYAALQAAAVEPDLFKAVAAIAPVTDLQQIKDDAAHYTNARRVADFVGSGPHVTEGSPLRNAASITAPVLLFHGDRDLNVTVGHSQRMDRALRNAGKQSSLHVYQGLEHDLADSSVRADMLGKIGELLESTIGGKR